MHELYELKDKLLSELEAYNENGKFSKDDAEAIKALSASIEHICNIVEHDEEDYSSEAYPDGMGRSYRYSRENGRMNRSGRSYARGRMNARRDSMGRYSRADGLVEELRGLMDDAPNETIKRDMQRLVDKLEQM